MSNQDFNPIKSVTPVDINGNQIGSTAYTNLPIPTSYKYQLTDISASDAGRTEDMKMHKMRKGQAVRVDLEWKYPSKEDVALLLTAFNSEYVKVNYLDAKLGEWQDRLFYVGDRNAPLWNSYHGKWESLGFGIIQQVPDVVTV